MSRSIPAIIVFVIVLLAAQFAIAGRYYHAATGRFLSVDQLAGKYPSLSPYNYSLNNPLNYVDPNGQYAVSIHYKMTYDALQQLGYNATRADLVGHYASVFADHPDQRALKWNNRFLDPDMSYREGINYEATKYSQSEGEKEYNVWHSMRTDMEAKFGSISRTGAMMRGMEFGWNKIFESASLGSIGSLEANSQGLEALGQGLHALQDAYAHRGASWSEHSLVNDVYGNQTQARAITHSAIIVHQILSGDFSNVTSGMTLNVTGMSQSQIDQLRKALEEKGYAVLGQ